MSNLPEGGCCCCTGFAAASCIDSSMAACKAASSSIVSGGSSVPGLSSANTPVPAAVAADVAACPVAPEDQPSSCDACHLGLWFSAADAATS